MKLYENVVIGNFLYGLGFAVRSALASEHPFPGVVNLLQQTPMDKELGDVLLTFPGLVRLIEFKMKGANLKKERLRHRALMAALSGEDLAFTETSKSLHWYVEVSPPNGNKPITSRVVPYLDAFIGEGGEHAPGGLERMIERTAREAVSELDAGARERAKFYLDLVRMTLGSDSTGGGGGLLLVMGASGALHFAQLREVSDLNLPDRVWLEQMRQDIGHNLQPPELGPDKRAKTQSFDREFR